MMEYGILVAEFVTCDLNAKLRHQSLKKTKKLDYDQRNF